MRRREEPAMARRNEAAGAPEAGKAAAERPASRRGDADLSRSDILDVATQEFAAHGLSGARVDAIAERTRTSKRMIYYHFGSKEGLYLAVLEKAYQAIRDVEDALNLANLDPETAIRVLIGSTFDYDEAHPEFVRLVAIENIHRAEHMARSETIARLNVSVIDALTAILERGRKEGTFRAAISAVDLHMMISAFCFFRVSNRHTFGTIFARDLSEHGTRARHRQMIQDAVVAYLKHG